VLIPLQEFDFNQSWPRPVCNVPLPTGMDIFQSQNPGMQLIHALDGGIIQIRSDYALWCTGHCGFVQPSDCLYRTESEAPGWKGIF
jgi:hypothetical protein